jgi:hypothetical protein
MSTIMGILDSTDDIPPTVTLTSPAAGNVAGTVTLQATAADNDKIATCQFTADAANIGSPITAAPFQLSYDTHALVNGAHNLGVTVHDRVRGVASASEAVTVKNGPAVNFYSPGNGATVTDTITLTAYVTNYGTQVSVQWNVDGTNVGSAQVGGSNYYQINIDTHGYAVGWHTFYCTATDAQGNATQASNQYYVNNQPPAAGTVMLGDMMTWDGAEWTNYHANPEGYDGSGGQWYWSNVGSPPTTRGVVYLPGNPNPTYYQMRLWVTLNRCEGGSDGYVIHYIFTVDGADYTGWWDNGPSYTNIGPFLNIGGGDSFTARRWADNPGWNTAFMLGVGAYYDFVPKYSS